MTKVEAESRLRRTAVISFNSFVGVIILIRKDETGAALPLTLIVMFVITLLGITLFMFSMTETSQVTRDQNKMKAHYLARSGAHAVATYLSANPETAFDLINSSDSEDVIFGDGIINVLVYGNPAGEIYVRSTGTVNDVTQSVVVTVENRGIFFPAYGNTVTFKADGNNAASIFGGDVLFGNVDGKHFNDIIVKEGAGVHHAITFDEVILPCLDPTSPFYGLCPTTPGTNIDESTAINVNSLYGTVKLNGGELHLEADPVNGQNLLLKAEQIDLGGNADMRITLDNNIIAIVVDRFEFTGNSEIFIEGDGRLQIYITGLFEGRSDFVVDSDSDVNVNVYILEGGEFKLAGTPNFTGSVYAPDADVELSGNSTVNGWVVADNIYGKGGVDINYVPHEIAETSMNINIFSIKKWRYDN